MASKHYFVKMGSIGLVVVLALNLFNQYVLGVGTGAWWSVWFPAYIVWFVFLAIGLGLSKKEEPKTGLNQRPPSKRVRLPFPNRTR